MALKLVESTIRNSLATSTPEVICLKGGWGTGKTYAWRKWLKDANAQPGGIALNRYSYVSLFGMGSLADLRTAMFMNSVPKGLIETPPSYETVKRNLGGSASKLGKKLMPLLKWIPWYGKHFEGVNPLALMVGVSSTLVCFDDLERRSKSLTLSEVFGLASELKEARKCKVVLIFNDDAESEDIKQVNAIYEKTVDKWARFAPTVDEACEIALNDADTARKLVTDAVKALRVSNIRMIRRIAYLVNLVHPQIRYLHEDIEFYAVHLLALAVWSIYGGVDTPSIEEIKEWKARQVGPDGRPLHNPEKAKWHQILSDYPKLYFSELDSVLIQGVKNGYFDDAMLYMHARKSHREIEVVQRRKHMDEQWDFFLGSMDASDRDAVPRLLEEVRSAIDIIGVSDLAAFVDVFESLGFRDEANIVIRKWILQNSESVANADFNDFPFNRQLPGTSVMRAITNHKKARCRAPTLKQVFLDIKFRGGWSPKMMQVLLSAAPKDYVEMFHSVSGKELSIILGECLRFGQFLEPSKEVIEVNTRIKIALRSIAEESPLNRIRLKYFGFEFSNQEK